MLGLGFALGMAEAATRLLGIAPRLDTQCRQFVKDPYLPYRPAPNNHGKGVAATGEYAFEYRHNSEGFRDVEHALAKPAGTVRILGLGDSFTYGMGAAFEETYLARLEAQLNQDKRGTNAPRFEVIKAGIPGYYPESQRLLLEHYGLAYQPDVVLVGFVPNDVTDTARGLEARVVDADGGLKTKAVANLGTFINRCAVYSHFCRFCVKKYADVNWKRDMAIDYDAIYFPNGKHEEDWRKVEAEYTKMHGLCLAARCELVVFHIPQRGPWLPHHAYPAQRLQALARKQGFGFVDALPALAAEPNLAGLYYPEDRHCTPAGYAVLARVLADYFRRR